jgi:hypothetical protein
MILLFEFFINDDIVDWLGGFVVFDVATSITDTPVVAVFFRQLECKCFDSMALPLFG